MTRAMVATRTKPAPMGPNARALHKHYLQARQAFYQARQQEQDTAREMGRYPRGSARDEAAKAKHDEALVRRAEAWQAVLDASVAYHHAPRAA